MATIDTLAYTKMLEAGGVDRKQAEAHAEAMSKVVIPELASQTDISALRSDLKALASELKLWLILSMITIAGFAIAVNKIL